MAYEAHIGSCIDKGCTGWVSFMFFRKNSDWIGIPSFLYYPSVPLSPLIDVVGRVTTWYA